MEIGYESEWNWLRIQMEWNTNPHEIGYESKTRFPMGLDTNPNEMGYESKTRFPMELDTNPSYMGYESPYASIARGDS